MSVILFANIFSQAVGCLFILFMVSFAVQKFLSLTRSYLFIFVFVSITLEDRSKKILLQCMSKSVLPTFFPRSFIVSDVTFRSLLHFECIFVYDLREFLRFTLLHEAVQFFLAPLILETFLHCLFFPSLSQISWP